MFELEDLKKGRINSVGVPKETGEFVYYLYNKYGEIDQKFSGVDTIPYDSKLDSYKKEIIMYFLGRYNERNSNIIYILDPEWFELDEFVENRMIYQLFMILMSDIVLTKNDTRLLRFSQWWFRKLHYDLRLDLALDYICDYIIRSKNIDFLCRTAQLWEYAYSDKKKPIVLMFIDYCYKNDELDLILKVRVFHEPTCCALELQEFLHRFFEQCKKKNTLSYMIKLSHGWTRIIEKYMANTIVDELLGERSADFIAINLNEVPHDIVNKTCIEIRNKVAMAYLEWCLGHKYFKEMGELESVWTEHLRKKYVISIGDEIIEYVRTNNKYGEFLEMNTIWFYNLDDHRKNEIANEVCDFYEKLKWKKPVNVPGWWINVVNEETGKRLIKLCRGE